MLAQNCFRGYFEGFVEGSAHALLPGQWDAYRQFEKFIMPDMAAAVLQTVADPPGHYLPRVFQPPILAGEMSLRTDGEGDLAGGLTPSRSMSLNLTGAGDLDATAALVISMLCAMTGAGTLTATIEGRLNMAVDFTGDGDLAAALAGIGSMAANLSGTGDLDATIAAIGNMSIDIVVTGSGLSTANVGAAVWDYILSCGYSADQAMQILTAVAAGKTTITDLGGGNAEVAFRDLQDTRDVVDADMTGSERTAVALDP